MSEESFSSGRDRLMSVMYLSPDRIFDPTESIEVGMEVKNTFIHWRATNDDMRSTGSAPSTLGGPTGRLSKRTSTVEPMERMREQDAEDLQGEDSLIHGSLGAPVKNTFLHYDDDQQDFRNCLSSPAGIMVPSLSGQAVAEEPAFVHMPADMQDAASGDSSEGTAPPSPTLGPRLSKLDMLGREEPAFVPCPSLEKPTVYACSTPAIQGDLSSLSGKVEVKNTFIHCSTDNDIQPDWQPARSGPAKLVGHCPWLNSASWTTRQQALSSLPSVGSAGHAQGNCKACAHNWKPGGCTRGHECTFCHLCDEDDFKRRRKEKLSRMKAEKVRRRVESAGSEQQQGGVVDEVEAEFLPDVLLPAGQALSEALAVTTMAVAAATSRAAAAAADSPCSPSAAVAAAITATVSPSAAAAGLQDEGGTEPALGELVVTPVGATAHVRWAVDLRKLRAQSRCGLSRRFRLLFEDEEVPFIFFVVPVPSTGDSEASASSAAKRKTAAAQGGNMAAVLRLKCADAALLGTRGLHVRVAFAAGNSPPRVVSLAHDFVSDPVCELPSQDAMWELVPSKLGGNTSGAWKCVLGVEVSPVGSTQALGR